MEENQEGREASKNKIKKSLKYEEKQTGRESREKEAVGREQIMLEHSVQTNMF